MESLGGERSSAGRSAACGPEGRGFNPRRSPQFLQRAISLSDPKSRTHFAKSHSKRAGFACRLREESRRNLELDLRDVKRVDQQVVTFLARCQASGTRLRNCPPYIREWIARETVMPQLKD